MDHHQESAVQAPVDSWKDSEPPHAIAAAAMVGQPPRRLSGSYEQTAPTQLAAFTLPVFLVVFPTITLTVLMIGLVFGYQVKEQPGLFPSMNAPAKQYSVLVNFPATRLVFLASWLSTLAPILAGPLMRIWRLQTAQSLQISSAVSPTDLPTASQFNSLIGLLEASSDQLPGYYRTRASELLNWRPRTQNSTSQRSLGPLPAPGFAEPSAPQSLAPRPCHPSLPPVLRNAGTMVTLCTISAIAVFAADTWLDVFTQTVRFDVRSTVADPSLPFSRGITEKCINFDRTSNECFPCSYAEILGYWSDLEINAHHNEPIFLQHNNSHRSEIRFLQGSDSGDKDLAIIIPQTLGLPANIDFRSSTIGVSTLCNPISSTCDMRTSETDVFHTQFNCSRSFWGVLGKPPNVTETNENKTKAVDPDLPGLDWKPSPNLQYGYFRDAELDKPYNPVGYNPETGDPDVSIPCTPDNELLNPVYLGMAGRFTVDSEATGSPLDNDSGVWKGPNRYIDFALSCSYTTYNVNYTWVNSSMQNVSYVPSPNGSISEIFHGMQIYDSISGGNAVLQDDLLQAALQNTSLALARHWGMRNTVWVLSTIGAYAVPQSTLQEQIRTELLVAKIPIAPLVALVASSLVYVVMAGVLGIVAYRASRSRKLRYIASQLTRDGLCNAAFGEDAMMTEMATLERRGGEEWVGTGREAEPSMTSAAPLLGTPHGHSWRVGVFRAGDYHGRTPFSLSDVLQDSGPSRALASGLV